MVAVTDCLFASVRADWLGWKVEVTPLMTMAVALPEEGILYVVPSTTIAFPGASVLSPSTNWVEPLITVADMT